MRSAIPLQALLTRVKLTFWRPRKMGTTLKAVQTRSSQLSCFSLTPKEETCLSKIWLSLGWSQVRLKNPCLSFTRTVHFLITICTRNKSKYMAQNTMKMLLSWPTGSTSQLSLRALTQEMSSVWLSTQMREDLIQSPCKSDLTSMLLGRLWGEDPSLSQWYKLSWQRSKPSRNSIMLLRSIKKFTLM